MVEPADLRLLPVDRNRYRRLPAAPALYRTTISPRPSPLTSADASRLAAQRKLPRFVQRLRAVNPLPVLSSPTIWLPDVPTGRSTTRSARPSRLTSARTVFALAAGRSGMSSQISGVEPFAALDRTTANRRPAAGAGCFARYISMTRSARPSAVKSPTTNRMSASGAIGTPDRALSHQSWGCPKASPTDGATQI